MPLVSHNKNTPSALQHYINKLTSVGWSQSLSLNENLGGVLDLLENWVGYHDGVHFKKQLLAAKVLVDKYGAEKLVAKASVCLPKHNTTLPENGELVALTGIQRYFLSCYLQSCNSIKKRDINYMAYRLRNACNSNQPLVEGDWVEFYTTAPSTANHLLKQPLMAIHKWQQVNSGNLLYSYDMPEFWSKEQSFWIHSRQPPEMTLRGKNTFLADQIEFEFLCETKIINKANPVHRIATIDFTQPLQMNWHDKLGIQDHKTSLLGVEMEIYYCYLLLLILCAGVINSQNHRDFGSECYLNLKRLEQSELVRAYISLLTLHCNMNEQNWVMMTPDNCIHTLLGLKPRFLVKVTKNIHYITEELISLGYIPNVNQYCRISPKIGSPAPITTVMTSLSYKKLQEHAKQIASVINANSSIHKGSIHG